MEALHINLSSRYTTLFLITIEDLIEISHADPWQLGLVIWSSVRSNFKFQNNHQKQALNENTSLKNNRTRIIHKFRAHLFIHHTSSEADAPRIRTGFLHFAWPSGPTTILDLNAIRRWVMRRRINRCSSWSLVDSLGILVTWLRKCTPKDQSHNEWILISYLPMDGPTTSYQCLPPKLL